MPVRIFGAGAGSRRSRGALALALLFSLYQKGRLTDEVIEEALRAGEEESRYGRIRCPLCLWRPNASSLWYCADSPYPEHFYGGCGTVWNTFDTRGLCPGCGHQWRWTSCLSCTGWSLHEDWYESDDEERRGE